VLLPQFGAIPGENPPRFFWRTTLPWSNCSSLSGRKENPALVVCDCSTEPGCNIWAGGADFDFH
jgi:hypothetical protein